MLEETKEKLSKHLASILCHAASILRGVEEGTGEPETISVTVTYASGNASHKIIFPTVKRPDETRVEFEARTAVQKVKQAKEHIDAAYNRILSEGEDVGGLTTAVPDGAEDLAAGKVGEAALDDTDPEGAE